MRRTSGFTIVEALIGMAIFGLLLAFSVPLLTSSIGSNAKARARTSAVAVAESWLDRYRAGTEPTDIGGPCSGSGTVVTCSYPVGYDFASDGITSHSQDAANMKATYGDFNTTIRASQLNAASSTSTTLWEVQVTVKPKAGTIGGDKVAILTSRFTQ